MNASWPSGGSQLTQPNVIGGRYRLEHEIASGGRACVYRATDLQLRRPVALKILRQLSADDQQVRGRFQREAKAAGRLNHGHIVALYDAGFDGSTAYLVMPLIEGPTLREELDRRGTFGVPEVIAVGRQIAGALDHAHAHGIVHRDIKPANILLVADRPNGLGGHTDAPAELRTMLLDFGIAQGIGESTTAESGELVAAAGYLAPERAQGRPATPASDLYSLGVVLSELLTGRLPFPAETAIAHLQSRVDAPPRSPGIPAPLADLVRRCLAIDPNRRPTAAQLATALFDLEQRSAAPTSRLVPDRNETARLAPVRRIQRPFGRPWALLLLPVLVLGGVVSAASVRERLSASSNNPPPATGLATIYIPIASPPTAVAPPTVVPFTPTRPPESVRVPDVAGRSERDARRTLSEVGFRPARDVTTVDRRDLPSSLRGACDGQVISTAPHAGTLLRPGSEVQITLCQPDNRGRQGNGPRNNRNDD